MRTLCILFILRTCRFVYKNVTILLLLGLLYLLIWFLITIQSTFYLMAGIMFVDYSDNYFRVPSGHVVEPSFLVNTQNCRIPELGLWNPEVKRYHRQYKPQFCSRRLLNVSYVDGNFVRINSKPLERLGLNMSTVKCCFQTITRKEQPESSYNHRADNGAVYSKCHPIKSFKSPDTPFIKVTCVDTSGHFHYTNFHAVAMFPRKEAKFGGNITRKWEFWQNCRQDGNCANINMPRGHRPPNVILIEVDSMSRMSFRRNLPKTVKVLSEKLKAVEMKGFTKVGENTFPNLIPVVTSLSVEELTQTCYPDRWKPLDNCPLIWKEFSERNYITTLIEDCPSLSIFNYERTGFIHAPTDIYARNWMIAAYNEEGWHSQCIGRQRHEKKIVDFLVDLATLAELRGVPYFFLTELGEIAHSDSNGGQVLDPILSKALMKSWEKGLLNNTLFIIKGDHGYRMGNFRRTFNGWFEDRLPALWIRVPDTLTESNQAIMENLLANSNKLMTAFDIHATMKDVLNFGNITKQRDKSPKINDNRIRGISLFSVLPDRTCAEAGVMQAFCACQVPEEYTNEDVILRAANATVAYVNARIPSVCVPLQRQKVFASGITMGNLVDGKQSFNLLLGLITIPGKFKLEATVYFKSEQDINPEVIHVTRTSKITRSTDCLFDNGIDMQNYEFNELVCFCRRMHSRGY